jgi:galactokinase
MTDQDTIEEYNERLEYLKQIPQFHEEETRNEMVKYFQIRYFNKQQTIVREDQPNKYINFLLHGQLRVDKKVQFIRRKNMVRPDREFIKNAKNELKDDEERMTSSLVITRLEQFHSFPELLPSSLNYGKAHLI